MRPLIKKGFRTIQNDGLQVFLTRSLNFAIVKAKRITRKTDFENLDKWKLLKDKYKGERIFIIGNGPSLNKMPLYCLKYEYTMCFNRFNLFFERLNWKPDFYVAADDLVIKDSHKEINTEILPNVQYAFFPDIHPSNLEVTNYIENRQNVNWYIADKPEFRADLPNCGNNKTVVNAGLQIAAFLGFSEIYLIGIDMIFAEQKVKKLSERDWEAAEDDPNHFDPRYFKKGRKYHNPTVHEMLEQFAIGKTFFDKLYVKIYNAGINGKLDIFPRVNFKSLFNFTQEEKKELIAEINILKERKLKVTDLDEISVVYEKGACQADVFKTSSEEGFKLIPELIIEYIPIGPYDEHYYFLKR